MFRPGRESCVCVYWNVARGPQNVFWLVSNDCRQANRRKPGQCNCSTGNASAAIQYFEAEAILDVVLPAFVQLDQNVFLSLGGYLATGVDLGPIKNSRRL